MKLALHRSIIFWAGIFVMGSILWGWSDSRQFLSTVGWKGRYLVQGGSGVMGGWSKERGGAWSSRREKLEIRAKIIDFQGEEILTLYWEGGQAPSPVLPGPLACGGGGRFAVFIPHWLMLAVVGLVWVSLLVWRGRRRRTNG